MKLRDIYESQYDYPPISELRTMVQKLCQPYIQAVGGVLINHTLWRGSHTPMPLVAPLRQRRSTIRKTSYSYDMHMYYKEHFKKLGFDYEQAVFTSAHVGQAAEYGHADQTYAVFPIGEFSFCYDPDSFDMFYHRKTYDELYPEDMPAYLKKTKYQTTNLKGAFGGREGEVLLTGDRAIYIEYETVQQMYKTH